MSIQNRWKNRNRIPIQEMKYEHKKVSQYNVNCKCFQFNIKWSLKYNQSLLLDQSDGVPWVWPINTLFV